MNSQALVLILASLCIFASAYYPSEYDLRFEPDYRNCNFKTDEEVFIWYRQYSSLELLKGTVRCKLGSDYPRSPRQYVLHQTTKNKLRPFETTPHRLHSLSTERNLRKMPIVRRHSNLFHGFGVKAPGLYIFMWFIATCKITESQQIAATPTPRCSQGMKPPAPPNVMMAPPSAKPTRETMSTSLASTMSKIFS